MQKHNKYIAKVNVQAENVKMNNKWGTESISFINSIINIFLFPFPFPLCQETSAWVSCHKGIKGSGKRGCSGKVTVERVSIIIHVYTLYRQDIDQICPLLFQK